MHAIDQRLKSGSHKILDLDLSEVRLKDNQYFPWVILIPKTPTLITEIFELDKNSQQKLYSEINRVSQAMEAYFRPDKLNIGALGNIVPQLHIHIIARFKTDLAWPHSLWQENIPAKKYDAETLKSNTENLCKLITAKTNLF